jgi:outer membrane protein TolC
VKADQSLSVWKTIKSRVKRSANEPLNVQLTLESAISRAMDANPRLRDLRARLPVGEARVGVAGQWPNPQFRLSEVALNNIIEGEPTMEFALRFRFETPGTLDARTHAAELRLHGLKARIEGAEQRVKRDLERSFLHYAIVVQELGEIEKELLFRLAHLDLVKERLAAGVGVDLDLALAALPHAKALDTRERLLAKRLRSVEEIRALVGATTTDVLEIEVSSPRMKKAREVPSEQEMIELAMKQRPELREVAARLGRAKAQAFLARAQRWPWPRFAQINYELRHPLEPARFGFAVGIELPIFDWHTERISLREAQISRLRVLHENTVSEIARQVATAHREAKQLRARLSGIEAHLLPAAERGAAALKTALEAGTLNPLRSTLVEERQVRARRAHLEALRDYQEALINLDAAAGIRR